MYNYKPLYEDTDTDGTALKYCKNDVIATKQMNREYISVIVDDKPVVIFKRNIIAVCKEGSHTQIVCVSDMSFYTKEDYASVIKKIIG